MLKRIRKSCQHKEDDSESESDRIETAAIVRKRELYMKGHAPADREMLLLKSPPMLAPSGYLKGTGPYDIFWRALEAARFGTTTVLDKPLHIFLKSTENWGQTKQLSVMEFKLLIFVQMQVIQAHFKQKSLSRALKQVLMYMGENEFPNRMYIDSVIYNSLTRAYITKTKLGKAYAYCELANKCLEFSQPNAWTALALESQAMVYLSLANVSSKASRLFYDKAFESYRLAFEHCRNHNTRILKARDHYLVQMIYIKMQVTRLMGNAPDIALHQFEDSYVSPEDIISADHIFRFLKDGWVNDPTRINSYHLVLCGLAINLRKVQRYIQERNISESKMYLDSVISVLKGHLNTCDVYDVTTFITKQVSHIADRLSERLYNIYNIWTNQTEGFLKMSEKGSEAVDLTSDVTDTTEYWSTDLPRLSPGKLLQMDRDYSTFVQTFSGRKLPPYVQGYQPGTMTPKVYVDVDKGHKSEAEEYFYETCPELMEKEFIYVGEQEGSFSLIIKPSLAAGTLASKVLSETPFIQHGSPLAAVSQGELEESRSNKNIRRISDFPEVESCGSLGGCFVDKQTHKLYLLSGWHPLKGHVTKVGDKDVITVTPGSTPVLGEDNFPVLTECEVDGQGQLYHVGSRLYGGFTSVEGEDNNMKAVDVAVLEASEDVTQRQVLKLFPQVDDEDTPLGVYTGPDKSMLTRNVQKTGATSKQTNGHIIAVNRSVYVGDNLCGGCFLVRHSHKKKNQFASYGDSGALVLDNLDHIGRLPTQRPVAYGLCHSVHHKYILHETKEEIDTTCCVRLDYCLKFIKTQFQLDLEFVTLNDLQHIFGSMALQSRDDVTDSGIGGSLEDRLSALYDGAVGKVTDVDDTSDGLSGVSDCLGIQTCSEDTLQQAAQLIEENKVYDVFHQLGLSTEDISKVWADFKDRPLKINLKLLQKWRDRSTGSSDQLVAVLLQNGYQLPCTF